MHLYCVNSLTPTKTMTNAINLSESKHLELNFEDFERSLHVFPAANRNNNNLQEGKTQDGSTSATSAASSTKEEEDKETVEGANSEENPNQKPPQRRNTLAERKTRPGKYTVCMEDQEDTPENGDSSEDVCDNENIKLPPASPRIPSTKRMIANGGENEATRTPRRNRSVGHSSPSPSTPRRNRSVGHSSPSPSTPLSITPRRNRSLRQSSPSPSTPLSKRTPSSPSRRESVRRSAHAERTMRMSAGRSKRGSKNLRADETSQEMTADSTNPSGGSTTTDVRTRRISASAERSKRRNLQTLDVEKFKKADETPPRKPRSLHTLEVERIKKVFDGNTPPRKPRSFHTLEVERFKKVFDGDKAEALQCEETTKEESDNPTREVTKSTAEVEKSGDVESLEDDKAENPQCEETTKKEPDNTSEEEAEKPSELEESGNQEDLEEREGEEAEKSPLEQSSKSRSNSEEKRTRRKERSSNGEDKLSSSRPPRSSRHWSHHHHHHPHPREPTRMHPPTKREDRSPHRSESSKPDIVRSPRKRPSNHRRTRGDRPTATTVPDQRLVAKESEDPELFLVQDSSSGNQEDPTNHKVEEHQQEAGETVSIDIIKLRCQQSVKAEKVNPQNSLKGGMKKIKKASGMGMSKIKNLSRKLSKRTDSVRLLKTGFEDSTDDLFEDETPLPLVSMTAGDIDTPERCQDRADKTRELREPDLLFVPRSSKSLDLIDWPEPDKFPKTMSDDLMEWPEPGKAPKSKPDDFMEWPEPKSM